MTNTGEVEQEGEPQHPGWQSLARVLDTTAPFFEQFLFLRSVDTFSSNIYVIMGDYLTLVDPGNDYTAFMDLSKLQLELADIKKVRGVSHRIKAIVANVWRNRCGWPCFSPSKAMAHSRSLPFRAREFE